MSDSGDSESFPHLAGDEPAGHASRRLLRHLLQVLLRHQQALLQGQDGEALHDFRVAMRRSRSALRQIRPVFLPATIQPHLDGFAELSRITCAVRDGEVYLAAFTELAATLDSPLQTALTALLPLLAERHAEARQQLLGHLQSAAHQGFLADWEDFLRHAHEAGGSQPLKPLADRRLGRLYRRLLREGAAIDESSPPQALHELRKTCKKLRYLLEFFHSLYPAKPHRQILGLLKDLQEILGEYQDCQVQAAVLLRLAEEEGLKGATPMAYAAMGVLYQRLLDRASQSRGRFTGAYTLLAADKTRRCFAELLAAPGR